MNFIMWIYCKDFETDYKINSGIASFQLGIDIHGSTQKRMDIHGSTQKRIDIHGSAQKRNRYTWFNTKEK